MAEKIQWKLSSKWASRCFDCTAHGCVNYCKGNCCRHAKWWPPNAFETGVCGYLTDTGCSLSIEQRPIGCLLSPFQLSKTNVMVIHHSIFFKWHPCNPCVNKGPRIIDALKGCYTYLFGEKIYGEMIKNVDQGKDFSFVPPEMVTDTLKIERAWMREKKIPEPRHVHEE